MKKITISAICLGLLSLFFTSCQTLSGAGRDIQSAGSAIRNAAGR